MPKKKTNLAILNKKIEKGKNCVKKRRNLAKPACCECIAISNIMDTLITRQNMCENG